MNNKENETNKRNFNILMSIQEHSDDYIIVPRQFILDLISSADSTIIDKYIGSAESTYEPNDLRLNDPLLFQKVKKIRKKLGVSQEKLANLSELKQPDISNFEKGNIANFGIKRKKRIVNALKQIHQINN